MRRTQMATTPASRFGRAGFNPTAGFLAGKVTTEILEFVDERGGIGKTARTTPSPQSDGRSVSPARCFVTARDETGDIYAVDWRFFCFETAVHDDPVAQTRGFLSRCEDALRCVGGLHAFKVGITRYPARRWNNKNFGYKFEGYQGMFMLSYAAMGAGALERDAMAFLRGHAEFSSLMQNVALRGGEGHSVEKPGFVYVVYNTSDRVQRRNAATLGPAAKRFRSASAMAASVTGPTATPSSTASATGPTATPSSSSATASATGPTASSRPPVVLSEVEQAWKVEREYVGWMQRCDPFWETKLFREFATTFAARRASAAASATGLATTMPMDQVARQ